MHGVVWRQIGHFYQRADGRGSEARSFLETDFQSRNDHEETADEHRYTTRQVVEGDISG